MNILTINSVAWHGPRIKAANGFTECRHKLQYSIIDILPIPDMTKPRGEKSRGLGRKTESPCLHCTNILEMCLYFIEGDGCEVVHFNTGIEILGVWLSVRTFYYVAVEVPVDITKVVA